MFLGKPEAIPIANLAVRYSDMKTNIKSTVKTV
jgi:hypothetical protein